MQVNFPLHKMKTLFQRVAFPELLTDMFKHDGNISFGVNSKVEPGRFAVAVIAVGDIHSANERSVRIAHNNFVMHSSAYVKPAWSNQPPEQTKNNSAFF